MRTEIIIMLGVLSVFLLLLILGIYFGIRDTEKQNDFYQEECVKFNASFKPAKTFLDVPSCYKVKDNIYQGYYISSEINGERYLIQIK